jgi:DNA-binding MarR family transcriptional regulator
MQSMMRQLRAKSATSQAAARGSDAVRRRQPLRNTGHDTAVAPAGSATLDPRQTPVMVDQSELQQLVGYSCRRAHAVVRDHAAKCLAAHDLPPGWFTVLVLLSRNPGLSSRQLCQVLGVKPPNFVALVASFESRDLIERRAHPNDSRSLGLHLTPAGRRLVSRVRREVLQADLEATAMLDDNERRTLLALLRKIYDGAPDTAGAEP